MRIFISFIVVLTCFSVCTSEACVQINEDDTYTVDNLGCVE